MRQMADNDVVAEARVDEKRRNATPVETNMMEAGDVFPFLDSRNLYLVLFTEKSSGSRCDGGW